MDTRDKIGLWAENKSTEATYAEIPLWLKDLTIKALSMFMPRCSHVDYETGKKCHKQGEPCWLPTGWLDDGSEAEEEIEWVCFEHMHTAGFCYACRQFWAGCEDFDFGNGLCSNCRSDSDYGEDDYYDSDLSYFDGYGVQL